VFFNGDGSDGGGGGPEQGLLSMSQAAPRSPDVAQPDPNPTLSAPNTAASANGGINPVAGELSRALEDNAVSPEEALQMMNDFVSGNQDMNKAAKNIEGMLGQITSTRHTAPEPAIAAEKEAAEFKPPADVAQPMNDDMHRFISNSNELSPDLSTGFTNPNLHQDFHKGPSFDSSVIPSSMFEGSNAVGPQSITNHAGPPTNIEFQNNDKPSIETEQALSPQSQEPIEPQQRGDFHLPEEFQQQQDQQHEQQQENQFHDERPQESREAVMSKLNRFSTDGPPPPVDVYEGQVPDINKFVQQQTGETRSPTPSSIPVRSRRPQQHQNINNQMVMEPIRAEDDGYANPVLGQQHTGEKMRKLIPDISSGKATMSNILDKMDPHEIPGESDPSTFIMNKHSFSGESGSISKLDQSLVQGIEGNSFETTRHRPTSLANMFSKPISDSEYGDDMNQPIGRPMPVFGDSGMGLPVGDLQRKFKTPRPMKDIRKLHMTRQHKQTETGKKRNNLLADMYADSLFPEDGMDIASLQGSLQGKTLTNFDAQNRGILLLNFIL